MCLSPTRAKSNQLLLQTFSSHFLSLLMKTPCRWSLELKMPCLLQLLLPLALNPSPLEVLSLTFLCSKSRNSSWLPTTARPVGFQSLPRQVFSIKLTLVKNDIDFNFPTKFFVCLFSSWIHFLYLPFHFYLSRAYLMLKFWLQCQLFY